MVISAGEAAARPESRRLHRPGHGLLRRAARGLERLTRLLQDLRGHPSDAGAPGADAARLGPRGRLRRAGRAATTCGAARRPRRRDEADAAGVVLRRTASRAAFQAAGSLDRRRGPAARRLAEAERRGQRATTAGRPCAASRARARSCGPPGTTARRSASSWVSVLHDPARLDVLDLGPRQVGALEALDPVHHHVQRALAALEAAGGEQRAARTAPPAGSARSTGGGMIRLIVPCSSSSSMNVTPLAVAGRWRATTRPATRTRLPCWMALELLARAQVAGQAGPHQLQRVLAQRDAGGPVVGQHPLPGGERAQLRPRVRLERQGELGALRHRGAGHRHPQLPERPPAPRLVRAVEQLVARPRPGEPAERLGERARAPGEVPERAPAPTPLPLLDQARTSCSRTPLT